MKKTTQTQSSADSTPANTSGEKHVFTYEDWMPKARQLAAQCWCDDETKDRVMDTVLAEAVAKRIAGWMDTATGAYRDVEFYHGITTEIGEMFGVAAKTSDDGSIQQDVLVLKVPELVRALFASRGVEPANSSQPSESLSEKAQNAIQQTEGERKERAASPETAVQEKAIKEIRDCINWKTGEVDEYRIRGILASVVHPDTAPQILEDKDRTEPNHHSSSTP